MNASTVVGPAQVGVLPRAFELLRILANAGDAGLRLQEVVAASGLTQPTTHRLLADLAKLGMIARSPDRRYLLGTALEDAGLTAPTPAPLRDFDRTRQLLQLVADEVGDTVYLAGRAFGGANYLLRCDGDSPVREFTVAVGEVKPLATSYAGLALLSGLDEPQRERHLAATLADIPAAWLPGDPASVEASLRAAIAQVHDRGWCGGIALIPDIAGVACPVPTPVGAPVLAITVSAAAARLPLSRVEALGPRLLAVADQLA